MIPKFHVGERNGYWVVDVFYMSEDNKQEPLFADWDGFEEPFTESDYQKMADWCYNTFKTWLTPRRARRMAFNQFQFKSKNDAEWFMLYWSGVDISVD